MSIVSVVLIAVALAMDAFAVSIASGIAIKHLRIRHAFTIALWFGAFQAIMPVLGWLGGTKLKEVVSGVDHWVVFGMLTVVGCKMIYEATQIDAVEKKTDPLDIYVLFVLSVATSLDALAAGISFAVLGVSIIIPVIVIGVITFIMSFAGVWIGDKRLMSRDYLFGDAKATATAGDGQRKQRALQRAELAYKEDSSSKNHVKLATALFDMGQFDDAEKILRELLDKGDDVDIQLLTDLGFVYKNLGQPEKAKDVFLRAVKLDPKHWPAMNGVGCNALNTWLLSKKRDKQAEREAKDSFRSSLRTNQNQPAVIKLLTDYRM